MFSTKWKRDGEPKEDEDSFVEKLQRPFLDNSVISSLFSLPVPIFPQMFPSGFMCISNRTLVSNRSIPLPCVVSTIVANKIPRIYFEQNNEYVSFSFIRVIRILCFLLDFEFVIIDVRAPVDSALKSVN